MALETNLSVAPYFDDFNDEKNFHRILFRPGFAVQARELTQMQSILQNQIERFANRVVHDGKVVSGCKTTMSRVSYVKLFDKNSNSALVDVDSLFGSDGKILDAYVVGETSGVRATLVDALEGSEAAAPNYLTIFVNYEDSGTDNNTHVFNDDEVLNIRLASDDSGVVSANTIASGATGYGARATSTDGIIYHKGNFIRVESQSAIVDRYNVRTTKKVGFKTVETIIDSNADSSLLDNASGSSNESAPGANRLKLSPVLTSRQLAYDADTANTETFFAINYVEDGTIVQQVNDNLGGVDVSVAERFGEIHGNFAIRPFNVRIREHQRATGNLGVYEGAAGDINKLVAEVEPSIGYISGKRVDLLEKVQRPVNKATETLIENDATITQSMGNYVLVREVCGNWDIGNLATIELHDTAIQAGSNQSFSETTPPNSGDKIGTARVRAISLAGENLWSHLRQYRLYLFDIRMSDGKSFKDVRAFVGRDFVDTNVHAFADVVLEGGNAVLKEPSLSAAIYKLGPGGTALYQDGEAGEALTEVNIVYRTEKDVSAISNQEQAIDLSSGIANGTDEVYEVGDLDESNEAQFLVVAAEEVETANKAGTIAVSGTTVTGTDTQFLDYFGPKDFIRYSAGGTAYTYRISSVDSDTQITLEQSGQAASAGTSYKKVYQPGHYFDFYNARGVPTREVTTSGSVATFDFGETWAAAWQAKVYANIRRKNATKASKDVLKDRYVRIDVDNNTNGAAGPWYLGVPDVYKITGIYQGSSSSVSTSDSDVTNQFELVTGQTDGAYGISSIRKKANSSLSMSGTWLLVKFNHFVRNTSSGIGFFSADSYPIDDADPTNSSTITSYEIPEYVSPTTGTTYLLRDSIDYRCIYANTCEPKTTASTSPTNPADSTTIDIASPGFAMQPAPSKNMDANVEYYLPRRDRIVMTKEGNVEIMEGVPSIRPLPPLEKAGSMTLATLDVPVYPSLSPYVGRKNNRSRYSTKLALENNRRYTMKDLRTMEKRVQNLEYYSSLNALEASAKNKQLFNPDTGLDRYKNGFLVDNFDGHNISDVTMVGYKAAIDRTRNHLRPLFDRYDLPLEENLSFTGSSNVAKYGDLVMLTKTDTSMVEQLFASKKRNPCQEISFNWRGSCQLVPPADNVPDTRTSPEVQIDFQGMYDAIAYLAEEAGVLGTDWGAWQTVSSTTTTSQSNFSGGTTFTSTTLTDQIREGLTTEISASTEVQSLGTFVENVAAREFMRGQKIRVYAYGLRPNTRFWPFFDGEPVTDYFYPIDSDTGTNTGGMGGPIISNENGSCGGYFHLPNDDDLKFRVGTRRFELKDIENLTTDVDLLTSSCHADFTSSPLDITYRGTSVNMVTPQFTVTGNTDTQTLTSTSSWTEWEDLGDSDPLAQTFSVNEGTSDGAFLTKIDLFFASKDSKLPVTIDIRKVNLGIPTSEILPYASATVQADDVVVDNVNGSEPTTFTFETPVFLETGKDYAFVVKPAGNSTKYSLWTAELGGTDVVTNELIHKVPYSGVMLVSSNDRTWNPVQAEDIKFKLYKAQFTTDDGVAYVQNKDTDHITYTTLVGSFIIGETLTSGSGDLASGELHFHDPSVNEMHITDITGGNFAVGETLTGDLSGATCVIGSIDTINMNTVVPRLPAISYGGTSIGWSVKTTTSGTIGNDYTAVQSGDEKTFPLTTKQIRSYSDPVAAANEGSTKTLVFKAAMSTDDPNVSPVFDSTRLNAITLHNLINNDATDEHKDVGNAAMRYATKPVVLADGNEAEDLKVWVTAYKPAGTDVKVYARIHNSADQEALALKDWTPLSQITDSTRTSDPIDTNDFIEFEYGFAANTDNYLASTNCHASLNTADNDIVTYRAKDGSLHATYKTFAVKIVLTGGDGSKIPLCRDLRAVALQK